MNTHKALIAALILAGLFLSGCKASETATLLSYDAITAAAIQAQVGVDSYNTSVKAESAKKKEAVLAALAQEIVEAVQTQQIDANATNEMATHIVSKMRQKLADLDEQEARRANCYQVTTDNLTFIKEVAEQGRKFNIYSSSVAAQYQQYMETQATKITTLTSAVSTSKGE